MCKKHRNCNYGAVLDYFCPLPQQLGAHPGNGILDFNVEPKSIDKFLRFLVKKVVPLKLFGTLENRNAFLLNLGRISTLNRFDSLSLREFTQNIQISKIEWLQSSRTTHSSPSDSLKKQEMMKEFVLWLITNFIIPLIKVTIPLTSAISLLQRLALTRIEYYFSGTKSGRASMHRTMILFSTICMCKLIMYEILKRIK